MILERLSVHGFSSAFATSTATLDFADLRPGVFAWCGPNGAGKTTAMESIFAAFFREFPSYGYAAARHVAPGVRDASIELIFWLRGADRYRLRVQCDPAFGGGRGKTEHYLDAEKDRAWSAVSGPNVRDTDAALAALIPTRELFLAGPFAAQRGAGSFFALEKADKKRLFVEMLGHGALQLLHARAAERNKSCGIDLETWRRKVDELRALDARRRELEAAAEPLSVTVEECTAAVAELAELAGTLEDESSAARERLAAALATAKAEAARLAELAATRDQRVAALRGAELDLADAERAAAVQASPYEGPPVERAREFLEQQRAAAQAATARVQGADRAVEAASAAARDAKHLQAQVATGLVRAQAAAQLDGVDLAVDLCAVCPLTTRARMAEQEAGALEPRVRDADAALTVALEDEAQITQAREIARRAAFDATVALRQAAAVEFAARSAELEAGRARALIDAVGDRRHTAGWAQAALVEAQERLEAAAQPEAEGELAALRQAAAEAGGRLVELVERSRVLDDARLEAERELARTLGELRGTMAQIGGADLAVEAAQLEALQRAQRSWSLLEVGLGPNGVQALEIDAAGPDVSALANGLLADGYGPRFQIRLETTRPLKSKDGHAEVFEVAVIDAEAQHAAHTGSGGEMVIVEEALRLALAIYSTTQSGRECLTLFRDEAAGALDEWPGADRGMRYLDMLRAARERGGFHQVHFIAHRPALFQAADGRFIFGDGAARYEEG